MLHNAMRVGAVKFPQKSATKVYGSILSVLRGGGCLKFPEKKCYATREWA